MKVIDARGCWRDASAREMYRLGPVYRFKAQTWKSLPFEEAREASGRRVLRSLLPAIGKAGAPYHPHYLPHGWHAPDGQP